MTRPDHAARRRSPLREAPLRNPGEGLERQFGELFLDWVGLWAALVGGIVMVVLYEWWNWLFDLPPRPLATTLGACLQEPGER